MKRKMHLVIVFMLIFAVSGLYGQGSTLAAGNIDAQEKFAWSAQAGWLNFRPDDGGVTVVPDGANGFLKGYVWAENIGWIKLGAGESSGPYANTSASDWGVNMDAEGKLSGCAWSSQAGWINFNPGHGGVSVDPLTGSFEGYAWGENIGWIAFQGNAPAYGVRFLLAPSEPAAATGHWTLY